MTKRFSTLLLAVLLVSGLILAGCGKSSSSSQQGAGAKGVAVPVAVDTAKRVDVSKELVASGQLVGEQSAVVSPKISGKVASVSVEVGSEVRAGDILFSLDDSDIRSQVQQAEAAVGVSRAKLKAAQDSRESATKQYERYKQLYEQGAVSADTFDSYVLKLQQAQSEEPEAALAKDEASLAYQRNQLANTVVTAPFSGTVAQRSVDLGNMVSTSTQAVTLVDLSRLKVQVSVGEEQIGKIKQGQEVKVVVPSVRTEPFTGIVSNLSPAADPKTKSYLIEIRMDNPDRILKQGMFAEVHIVTDRSEKALAIPVDAVVARAGENIVFTVAEGAAKENKVKLGVSDGKVTEIVEGLAEGDQVITLGQQGLVNGSKVAVQGGQAGKPEQGSQPKGEK